MDSASNAHISPRDLISCFANRLLLCSTVFTKTGIFHMILAATWKHVWLTPKTIEELEYFTNVEQLEQSEKDFSYEILRKVRCEHIKNHQRKKN